MGAWEFTGLCADIQQFMDMVKELEQQEYMDDMRKQAEMEDAAYAAEWQAVLDDALGVADRSSGGRYTPGLNPYGRVYSASGGRIGMQEGGMTYENMIDDEMRKAYKRMKF